MKNLAILAMLFLSACAHDRTEMDRELALKLADKTPVIVTASAPAPVVNIFNGGQQTQNHAAQSSQGYPPSMATNPDGSQDERKGCRTAPVFTVMGQLDHYEKHCFGGD